MLPDVMNSNAACLGGRDGSGPHFLAAATMVGQPSGVLSGRLFVFFLLPDSASGIVKRCINGRSKRTPRRVRLAVVGSRPRRSVHGQI